MHRDIDRLCDAIEAATCKIVGALRASREAGVVTFGARMSVAPMSVPDVVCPDCGKSMARFRSETTDGKGWIFGWLCECTARTREARP